MSKDEKGQLCKALIEPTYISEIQVEEIKLTLRVQVLIL
jgi:hypothetical protein